MRMAAKYGPALVRLRRGQATVRPGRTACRIDARPEGMVSAMEAVGTVRGRPEAGRNEIRDEIAAVMRRVQELEAQK